METGSNGILLSFVIPVYNVEDYLPECVDSILEKMTDDCEMILVDDGSTDSSGDICEQYAGRDSRIHVVHKENGGLSSARNAGMDAARGEYVTFVDSDDRIYSDSIPELLQWVRTEGADICFLHTVVFYPDGTQNDLGEGIVRSCLRSKTREDSIEYLSSRPKYPGSAWAKLFRREMLLRNNLHFPYDRRFSEDLGYMRDCILCADSFDFLDIPYYQYRQKRPGSITNKITTKNFYDLLQFVTETIALLTVDQKTGCAVHKSVMSFAAYEFAVLLYTLQNIPAEDRKAAMAALKDVKWVLKYANNRKIKVISLICSTCGLRFAVFLVGKFKNTNKK